MLVKTYGPFTRNYDRPEYKALGLEERARIMARQGHAFAQADEVRVVQLDEDGKRKPELIDCDFMQPGEIITRGNIVMKEASPESRLSRIMPSKSGSTTKTPRPPKKHSEAVTLLLAMLPSSTLTVVWRFRTGPKT